MKKEMIDNLKLTGTVLAAIGCAVIIGQLVKGLH